MYFASRFCNSIRAGLRSPSRAPLLQGGDHAAVEAARAGGRRDVARGVSVRPAARRLHADLQDVEGMRAERTGNLHFRIVYRNELPSIPLAKNSIRIPIHFSFSLSLRNKMHMDRFMRASQILLNILRMLTWHDGTPNICMEICSLNLP